MPRGKGEVAWNGTRVEEDLGKKGAWRCGEGVSRVKGGIRVLRYGGGEGRVPQRQEAPPVVVSDRGDGVALSQLGPQSPARHRRGRVTSAAPRQQQVSFGCRRRHARPPTTRLQTRAPKSHTHTSPPSPPSHAQRKKRRRRAEVSKKTKIYFGV